MSNHIVKKIQTILAVYRHSDSALTLLDSVESINTEGDKTHVVIACPKQYAELFQKLVSQAQEAIREEGIDATLLLTNSSQKQQPHKEKAKLEGIDKVIIVSSGKGGVGKSTIAFNLAVALAQSGKRVGLVDVDIYGPSLTALSGISNKPVLENNLMIPHKKFDVKMMSISFLVDEQDALIWRGPMTTKMLYQLIRLTNWTHDGAGLDYLIIDTPPGTGDVHISLAENYHIDGAIVVSTPQQLAVADVRRALTMCAKLKIPVIGIVENYSYLLGADGQKQYVFGKPGATDKIAHKFGATILASVPLHSDINAANDAHKPLPYYKPDHPISKIFADIIKAI